LEQKLRATQQVAKSHINEAKIKAKIYDQDITTRIFKIGNKVLLRDETLRRGRSKKLDAQWTRSYRVVEKIADVNYKIQIKRKTVCVQANRL